MNKSSYVHINAMTTNLHSHQPQLENELKDNNIEMDLQIEP